MNSYVCIGWSSGYYTVNAKGTMKGGVILQFVDADTGEDGYWVAFPVKYCAREAVKQVHL